MSLEEIADNTRTDKNTVHSYLPLYQTLLIGKKESAKNVLELGIWNGGSIKMWNDFFSNAVVHALDIRSADLVWDEIKNKERIVLYTGVDAYSPEFVQTNFVEKNVKMDFLLDDGPHSLTSMISFVKLYLPLMADDGIFIIEDVQDIKWIQILENEVPDEMKPFVKWYDLRSVKGRYDDIVFTVDRS